MKLNRQNKAILKSLDGEYKKFGKKVKSAVFAHCKGEDAVNDTLCDMFGIPAFDYVFAGGLDLDPARTAEILAEACEKAHRLAEDF